MKEQKWYYEYIVSVWYEDMPATEKKYGVVPAYNYAEAARKLADYYGEDHICDIKMSAVEDGEVYEFNYYNGNTFRLDVSEAIKVTKD